MSRRGTFELMPALDQWLCGRLKSLYLRRLEGGFMSRVPSNPLPMESRCDSFELPRSRGNTFLTTPVPVPRKASILHPTDTSAARLRQSRAVTPRPRRCSLLSRAAAHANRWFIAVSASPSYKLRRNTVRRHAGKTGPAVLPQGCAQSLPLPRLPPASVFCRTRVR
jgi:hypothetical protein